MQCNTCGNENLESDSCGSRMSDGRAFTDYRPRCHIQGDFFRQVGTAQPFTAYDSRMYLQKNATDLMQKDRARAEQQLGGRCIFQGDYEKMTTEMATEAVVRCNTSSCTRTLSGAPGSELLGDRRAY